MTRIPSVEWRNLAMQIRAGIESGRYPVGSRLPSEPALMQQYGGGRHSLRRALQELEVAGLIRTEHGRGSFVQRADILDYRISLRTRASESVGEQGRVSSDQPMFEQVLPATKIVSEALQIQAGEPVYMIVRHGFADDMPICVSTAYHPVARFPDIDKARRGLRRLSEIYASYGVRDYFRLKTTFFTCMPSPDVARALRLSLQQPVLATHKVDADPNGVPIAYSEAFWPGNRIRFTIDNSLEIARVSCAAAPSPESKPRRKVAA